MHQTPETQLAYLGFQLIPASPLLQPYISAYWVFQRASPLSTYHEEAMHPSGGFGLVFNFGSRPRYGMHTLESPVFLDGVNTITRHLGFIGHVDMMGIRFREGGAFPFLRIPLVELQNTIDVRVALNDVSLLHLHEQLAETPSRTARIHLLERWLLDRLTRGKAHNPLVAASLAYMREEIALLPQGYRLSSIPRLADNFGISQRQLEHLYRIQVGITPGAYMRLQRVQMARLALKQKRQSNTRLAADLGYHDQAHFIREFRSVVGITPYAYMVRKHGRESE
ncbi:MAG: helix-turn-helix domain-containing protein [Anaerolineae bacterium]